MKKGDKVREIGDTLTGTIVYIANGYADVKYPNMKGVCSLPVQFLERYRNYNYENYKKTDKR